MDFYATTAQVIPVLLLALVFESGYFNRIKYEDRSENKVFTKPVVRWWSLFMIVAALAGEAVMMLVLADILEPGDIAKGVGLTGVAALLGSMAVRLTVDVWAATKEPPDDPGAAGAAPGTQATTPL